MNESTKSISRRLYSPGFTNHYFVGHGIDVGSGSDSLSKYASLFPRILSITDFDLPDGDAQTLTKHKDQSFDFLHSSHCLEHLHNPFTGLQNWVRVVRPGGYLIILVPDEDLYEQGIWPSTYNGDHKHTFTIHKSSSWSPVSVNITQLIAHVSQQAIPIRIEQLHTTFIPNVPRSDQTLNPITESAIEIVLRRL